MITMSRLSRPAKKVVYCLAVLHCLSACKGSDIDPESSSSKDQDPSIAPLDACAQIEGRKYLSAALGEMGLTLDGVWLGHWSVSFSDGEMSMMQSDFGMLAQYECSDGKVHVVSGNVPAQTLSFDEDFKELYFNPMSQEPSADTALLYIENSSQPELNDAMCRGLKGAQFTDIKLDSSSSTLTRPAVTYALQFSETDDQAVEILEFGENYSGVYDCAFGEIHVHRSEVDERPIVLEVGKDGREASVSYADKSVSLYKVEESSDPIACTLEYNPVCAAKKTGIVCVTTPCPTEVHQTYSNACHAEAEQSRVLFEGECGEFEGEPVESDSGPVACTKEYAPVCGAVPGMQPCTSLPCPAATWHTFSNQCMAKAGGAIAVSEGDCKEEGQVVRSLPNTACTAHVDPVCAKDEMREEIQCLVAPCDSHEYRSFGNACEAFVAQASVVIDDACGDRLEGVLSLDRPPVVMMDPAETGKTPTVISAGISGDVLTAEIAYSGCDEQHFSLMISPAFMESYPVQVAYAFIPVVEDECEAVFQTTFEYDLKPLKAVYQSSYQTDEGRVDLGGLGLYEF